MNDSRRRQYPAQTGLYKVKVKGDSSWRFFDSCRLQISVGQEKHEGEKFNATIAWAATRFKKVVICVNDTLQRYNLMAELGLTEEIARERAFEMGTRWIGQVLAPHLDKDPVIIRWDYWLNHPDYPEVLKKINGLYAENEVFRSAVEAEIDVFMLRRENSGQPVTQWHKSLSRRYLLEESAVFPLMFQHDRAADVYPGTTLLPVRLAEEGKIEGYNPTGNVVFTRIDFVKNEVKERAA